MIKNWPELRRRALRLDATHAHYAGEFDGEERPDGTRELSDKLHQKLNDQLIGMDAPGKVYKDGSVLLDDDKESTRRGMERRLARKGFAIGRGNRLVKLDTPIRLTLKDVSGGVRLHSGGGVELVGNESSRAKLEKFADDHGARVVWESASKGRMLYGRSYVRTDETHAHYAGELDGASRPQTAHERRASERLTKYLSSPEYAEKLKASKAFIASLPKTSGGPIGSGPLDTPEGRKTEAKRLAAEIKERTKQDRLIGTDNLQAALSAAQTLRGLADGSDDPEMKKLAEEARRHLFNVQRNRDTYRNSRQSPGYRGGRG